MLFKSHSAVAVLGLGQLRKNMFFRPATRAGPDSVHSVQLVGVGPDHPVAARRPEFPRWTQPTRTQRCNVATGIASFRAKSVSSHSCSPRTPGSPTTRGRGPVRPRLASKPARIPLVNVAERFGG